jgi:hypothetical protein
MALHARHLIAVAALTAVAGSASAQTPAIGPRANQFPDVVVSSISSLTHYGTKTAGDVGGWAMTTVSCNIGYHDAIWYDDAGTEPYRNQHPVIAQQLYRVHNRRFEQIGFGWLKHGWCAADAPNCTNLTTQANYTAIGQSLGVNPIPSLAYRTNASCNWLGLFATDTYGAGLNAAQDDLGPRSEVNAWTGQFPYPYTIAFNATGDCVYKRMQVKRTDLRNGASQEFPGARYLAECIYIVTDEWPGQRYNNATHREVTINSANAPASNCATTGTSATMTGTLRTLVPAIQAYAEMFNNDADPNNNVKLITVDVPSDGRFYVASTVINNGNGTYTYEYAVFNYNSHRSAASFSIPKANGAVISNIGFKDVDYHSGEPFDATDWTATDMGDAFMWNTRSYDTDPNANALRWSTTYNFRFTTNSAPSIGDARLDLFRPGGATDPNFVTIVGLDVPAAGVACAADFNNDDTVSAQDIFDYLSQWNLGNPSTDFNGVGGTGGHFGLHYSLACNRGRRLPVRKMNSAARESGPRFFRFHHTHHVSVRRRTHDAPCMFLAGHRDARRRGRNRRRTAPCQPVPRRRRQQHQQPDALRHQDLQRHWRLGHDNRLLQHRLPRRHLDRRQQPAPGHRPAALSRPQPPL